MKKWSKEKVIQELKEVANNLNRTPRVADLTLKGGWDLVRASQRFFDTYTNAVKQAKLKPNVTYWSKSLIINELKDIYKQIGHTPTYRELRKIRLDLQAAIERYFKKYNNAIRSANLPLNNIRWSKTKIIKQLKTIAKKLNHTPTERELRKMQLCDLFGAIQRHFKSYNEAMESAGLTPNESFVNNTFWKEWEEFLIRVVKKLYGSEDVLIHRKITNGTKPDIMIKSLNKIIEIKLNISTETIEKDIENYLNYCNALEFWYLYGKHEVTNEKIKFLNSKKLQNLISQTNDKVLLQEFSLLKRGISAKGQKFICIGAGNV